MSSPWDGILIAYRRSQVPPNLVSAQATRGRASSPNHHCIAPCHNGRQEINLPFLWSPSPIHIGLEWPKIKTSVDEHILRMEWARSSEAHFCLVATECMEAVPAHGRNSHWHVCPEVLSHMPVSSGPSTHPHSGMQKRLEYSSGF